MNNDFAEIMQNLSEDAKLAFQKADYYSHRLKVGLMQTDHLLLGIAAVEQSVGATFLRERGFSLEDLEDAADVDEGLEENDLTRPGSMAMMSLTETIMLTLRMANSLAKEVGQKRIGTEHLLYSILSQTNSRAEILLENAVDYSSDFDVDELLDDLMDTIEKLAREEKAKKANAKKFGKTQLKFLDRYGVNLTNAAREGKLDTVIGRESEIERVVAILCRRTKSNPVLIGEAGVGKTAIVEGLATRIVKNDVPSFLIGKQIYQIDLSSLVAGTKFRGEFEERIKGVVDDATKNSDVLLFIDELHLLAGAGTGSDSPMDAANILKPALARGNLNLIGATTSDEYRRYIEKDKALARRFQTVMVNEPSAAVALGILKGVKPEYEKYHSVVIPTEILSSAIDMSTRYISGRYLPDKAIDVLDEACALTRVAADKKGSGKYKKLKIEKNDLEQKIDAAVEKQDYETAANLKTEAINLDKEIKKLEKAGAKKLERPTVTAENLAEAVSLKTGIPVSKVQGSELKLLTHLEEHLKESVIGQDEAVESVARAIRRGRSGVSDPHRPIGSFLFMGPTGVGKTELARVLAREVFGGEDSLIKIDMSEFSERHTAARLVGAPAGYVGYEDGGKLTEAVRRHPYSVVLFDEIEKAHPDVFNLFLQILEDGVLTDGQGETVHFNNTIIIMTSNLGSAQMARNTEFGFTARSKKDKQELSERYEENKEAAMKAMKKLLRPELINRLDSIQVFHSLTEKDVSRIFDNLLSDLKKRLNSRGIGLSLDPKAKKHLISKGYDPENGVRPLRRVLEDELETLLSDAIISGKLEKGDTARVTFARNRLKLEKTSEAKIRAAAVASIKK